MANTENKSNQSASSNEPSDLFGFQDNEKEVYQEMTDVRTSLNNKILMYGLIVMAIGFAAVIILAFCY